MAVSYVGVTSGNTAAGTSSSLVTALPSGWAAGDVAVLTGHVRGTALSMSTPAGWTLVPGPTWPVNQGTNSRAYAWYRVLQAGDTAPTITVSGAMTGGWSMTVYRDADGTSPVGQVGTSVVSGTSLTAPTLTGMLAGSALAVAAHAGVSTGTIPTNLTLDGPSYTEVVDHATSRATTNANQRMAAGYRLISSAGSYGGEAFTTDVSSSMVAVLVEVVAATAAAVNGTAALPADSALTASGSTIAPGTAALPAAATIVASATVRVPATATLATTSSLAASGTVRVSGAAALTATGGLTAAGVVPTAVQRGCIRPAVRAAATVVADTAPTAQIRPGVRPTSSMSGG